MTQDKRHSLNVYIEEECQQMQIAHDSINSASTLIMKMDADMDGGWQMGPRFLTCPSRLQRCQIAANRLLTALHQNNQATATLMAAYIIVKLPTVANVFIDTNGELENTQFYDIMNQVVSA